MIEIAICDDEIVRTSKIENILEELSEEMGIKVEIDVFYDGKKRGFVFSGGTSFS